MIDPDLIRDNPPSERIAIGRAMYEKDVLPNIPHVRKGMMVVLDIASGDYEVDSQDAEAAHRLRQRRPNAVTHTEQVGSPVPHYAVSIRLADD